MVSEWRKKMEKITKPCLVARWRHLGCESAGLKVEIDKTIRGRKAGSDGIHWKQGGREEHGSQHWISEASSPRTSKERQISVRTRAKSPAWCQCECRAIAIAAVRGWRSGASRKRSRRWPRSTTQSPIGGGRASSEMPADRLQPAMAGAKRESPAMRTLVGQSRSAKETKCVI